MKLALLMMVAGSLAGQDPASPTIRVPVRLVTAPTLVFGKTGRPILNLEPADFRVFDNGTPQKFRLETASAPVSAVLVVQANPDMREYLPFVVRTGSVVESLLLGESGEAAVVVYGDEVTVAKPFDSGEVSVALHKATASGKRARMIDAGIRAAQLLCERSQARTRILVFVAQSLDNGSEAKLDGLLERLESDNVTVFALTLPEIGKAFVSDHFALEALSSRTDRGGFKASVDLGKLVSAAARADPLSQLTAATGGTQIHFRKQRELEDALSAVGVQLRSSYLVSWTPSSAEPGYHAVRIDVAKPGAKSYSRPGYWLPSDPVAGRSAR